MPRSPRTNAAGTIHHVYARGVAGTAIFLDDLDRRLYLRMLHEVSTSLDWNCLAHCLMTNHVHLLVKTADSNLALGIQSLHGRYAQKFNFRHDRSGHLFQGRYGDTRIGSDAHLHAATMYIARNPVEAGLCVRPEDWQWTAFDAALEFLGLRDEPSTALEGV